MAMEQELQAHPALEALTRNVSPRNHYAALNTSADD